MLADYKQLILLRSIRATEPKTKFGFVTAIPGILTGFADGDGLTAVTASRWRAEAVYARVFRREFSLLSASLDGHRAKHLRDKAAKQFCLDQ